MDEPNSSPLALPRVATPGFAPSLLPAAREIPVRFTGDAREYFRIWVVNVALTVVTLGIYSAWAKVRTKRYFYRHTWVEDASFDYLAHPMQILRGRVVVAVALGLVFGAQFYSLPLYLALAGLLALTTPAVVVKSLAFNARASAYRNVRFNFLGSVREAYGVYLLAGAIYVFTLGIGYPYAQWLITEFVLRRHLLGDAQFEWSTRAKTYYATYFFAMLVALGVGAIGMLLGGVAVAVVSATGVEPSETLFGVVGALMYAPVILFTGAYVRARIANAVYGGLSIGPHWLESSQRAGDLARLYFENMVAIVLSGGLLAPWAKIRMARYRAEHLRVFARGALVAESWDITPKGGALGEAASDLGDFDLDLGL